MRGPLAVRSFWHASATAQSLSAWPRALRWASNLTFPEGSTRRSDGVGLADQLLHLIVGVGSLITGLAGTGAITVPVVTGAYRRSELGLAGAAVAVSAVSEPEDMQADGADPVADAEQAGIGLEALSDQQVAAGLGGSDDPRARELGTDAGTAEALRQAATVEGALGRFDLIGGTAPRQVRAQLDAAATRLGIA